jgi:hypothetical protein
MEFIIKYYEKLDSIADLIIFTHGHRKSWHYNLAINTEIKLLLEERKYVDKNDIGGLFCLFNSIFATRGWKASESVDDRYLWNVLHNGTELVHEFPNTLNYPCCGTMFVKIKAIIKRSFSTYKKLFDNIVTLKPELSANGICGIIFESSWSIILAKTEEVKRPPYCL